MIAHAHGYGTAWTILVVIPSFFLAVVLIVGFFCPRFWRYLRRCHHKEGGYNAFGWGCPKCRLGASFPTERGPDGKYRRKDKNV
jgi:hypothetical protein